jgi:hypothetical protein
MFREAIAWILFFIAAAIIQTLMFIRSCYDYCTKTQTRRSRFVLIVFILIIFLAALYV